MAERGEVKLAMHTSSFPAHPRTYGLCVNPCEGLDAAPFVYLVPIFGWHVESRPPSDDGDSRGGYAQPMFLDGSFLDTDIEVSFCGPCVGVFSMDEDKDLIVSRLGLELWDRFAGRIERLAQARLERIEWLEHWWPAIYAAALEHSKESDD